MKSFLMDYPVTQVNNNWSDKPVGWKRNICGSRPAAKFIGRCVLMTTDPGDLILDPTCGSGTTAYVAEQWGRRWITIDTSRVALALARARVMGARYPYYYPRRQPGRLPAERSRGFARNRSLPKP